MTLATFLYRNRPELKAQHTEIIKLKEVRK